MGSLYEVERAFEELIFNRFHTLPRNRPRVYTTLSSDAAPARLFGGIVFVRCPGIEAARIVEEAARENILLYATASHEVRLVTHHDVDDDDVGRLLSLLSRMS